MEDKGPTFEPLKTDNLTFREVNKNDKYDIYSLYSDPNVLRFDKSEPLQEMIEAEELINSFQQANRGYHSISWGIELNASKKIIGTCGFRNWDRLSHHAEIGGNFSSKHWGKGYGTETIKFLMEYGFNKMYLNKIYAYTNVNNSNVVKLMDKHGFQQEGRLREHHYLDGEFNDVFLLSLLKEDYKFH